MLRMLSVLVLVALVGASVAEAQQPGGMRPDPYRSRIELGPESYAWQAVRQSASTAAPRSYYGGATQQSAPSRAIKPFNTVVHEPTVSPYLHLYREERGDAAPNYHAFVRPLQQQYQANRMQATRTQQLEQQVRQATYIPSGSGSAARFGDTSHYYQRR